MRVITKLGIALCFAAGLSAATMENWTGKLMDADCYNKSEMKTSSHIAVTCVPTASTANFAFETGGKVRMLDPEGNSKAAAAFRDGLVKVDQDGDVHVTITGTRHDHEAIKVESIRGHKSNTSVH